MIFAYMLNTIFPHGFTFEGLVFTSDGVGVGVGVVSGIVSGVESVYNLLKIKNHSRKRSDKRDGIGVESERFHFLTTPSLTFRLYMVLWKPDCRSRNDEPITVHIPSFVIGLVLPLLLATPTNQFSLYRKNGVVSGILQFYFLPGCRTCKTTTTTTTTTTTEAAKKGDNRTKTVTRSSGKNSITKESFFLAKIMNACFTTRSAFIHKGS